MNKSLSLILLMILTTGLGRAEDRPSRGDVRRDDCRDCSVQVDMSEFMDEKNPLVPSDCVNNLIDGGGEFCSCIDRVTSKFSPAIAPKPDALVDENISLFADFFENKFSKLLQTVIVDNSFDDKFRNSDQGQELAAKCSLGNYEILDTDCHGKFNPYKDKIKKMLSGTIGKVKANVIASLDKNKKAGSCYSPYQLNQLMTDSALKYEKVIERHFSEFNTRIKSGKGLSDKDLRSIFSEDDDSSFAQPGKIKSMDQILSLYSPRDQYFLKTFNSTNFDILSKYGPNADSPIPISFEGLGNQYDLSKICNDMTWMVKQLACDNNELLPVSNEEVRRLTVERDTLNVDDGSMSLAYCHQKKRDDNPLYPLRDAASSLYPMITQKLAYFDYGYNKDTLGDAINGCLCQNAPQLQALAKGSGCSDQTAGNKLKGLSCASDDSGNDIFKRFIYSDLRCSDLMAVLNLFPVDQESEVSSIGADQLSLGVETDRNKPAKKKSPTEKDPSPKNEDIRESTFIKTFLGEIKKDENAKPVESPATSEKPAVVDQVTTSSVVTDNSARGDAQLNELQQTEFFNEKKYNALKSYYDRLNSMSVSAGDQSRKTEATPSIVPFESSVVANQSPEVSRATPVAADLARPEQSSGGNTNRMNPGPTATYVDDAPVVNQNIPSSQFPVADVRNVDHSPEQTPAAKGTVAAKKKTVADGKEKDVRTGSGVPSALTDANSNGAFSVQPSASRGLASINTGRKDQDLDAVIVVDKLAVDESLQLNVDKLKDRDILAVRTLLNQKKTFVIKMEGNKDYWVKIVPDSNNRVNYIQSIDDPKNIQYQKFAKSIQDFIEKQRVSGLKGLNSILSQ